MKRWSKYVAFVFLAGAVFFVTGPHSSVVAATMDFVIYVSMGETCPRGWQNGSTRPELINAYLPAKAWAAPDICTGGF